MTPKEAQAAIKRLLFLRRQVILTSMTRRLMWARDRAVNWYMYPKAGPRVAARPRKLTHRSGKLGRSTKVNPPRVVGENRIVGGLITGGPTAPYGPIHETGGQTRPHEIRPIRGSMLRWQGPHGPAFARSVHHPGSKIPARPRLRPSLEDAMPLIRDDLRKGFAQAQRTVGL